MDAVQPRVRVQRLSYAPKTAPCLCTRFCQACWFMVRADLTHRQVALTRRFTATAKFSSICNKSAPDSSPPRTVPQEEVLE